MGSLGPTILNLPSICRQERGDLNSRETEGERARWKFAASTRMMLKALNSVEAYKLV